MGERRYLDTLAFLPSLSPFFHHTSHLLQLCVFEVVSNHELQHVKELAVGNVSVLVHVVDLKSNYKCTETTTETTVSFG